MAPDTRDAYPDDIVEGLAVFFKTGKDILERMLEGKVA